MRKSPIKDAITAKIAMPVINKAPNMWHLCEYGKPWMSLYSLIWKPWDFYEIMSEYVEQEDGKR